MFEVMGKVIWTLYKKKKRNYIQNSLPYLIFYSKLGSDLVK